MTAVTRKPSLTVVLLLASALLGSAQQPQPGTAHYATVVGTVMDVTGATVPAAHVVLQEVNEARSVDTSQDGFFSFENVVPGNPFHIQVTAPELERWISNEIVLQPGQSFIVPEIALGIATVQTSVTAATPEEVAVEQVKMQEQQRVFGVVPNFYVTYEKDAAPLTPKLKFQLALKALTDPVTISGFGMNAAIYQAAGYPSYGQLADQQHPHRAHGIPGKPDHQRYRPGWQREQPASQPRARPANVSVRGDLQPGRVLSRLPSRSPFSSVPRCSMPSTGRSTPTRMASFPPPISAESSCR